MLRAWLGATSLEAFVAHDLHAAPVARPSTVRDPDTVLDWELLDEVLAGGAADTLVILGGQRLAFPPPGGLDDLQAYFRMGVGLCLRHTERCHARLRAIADAFDADLGAAHVQIFATPAGTHGFGWHYDDEDVFIAQTAGVKDYYLRANTVAADLAAGASAFARFTDEVSALHCATLVAGDFLYIPSRWWHVAMCRETALSVSVGVLT